MVELEDQRPLEDLMADIRDDEPVDLLLHSAGGIPEAAEALIRLTFRPTIRPFRVIVPSAAKSAATLMALAADTIVMGPSSQLGPIDPQVYHPGFGIHISANAVLKARNALIERGEDITPAELVMASKLDPAFVEMCRQARERAKVLAASWLKSGMLKTLPPSQAEEKSQTYRLYACRKRAVHCISWAGNQPRRGQRNGTDSPIL